MNALISVNCLIDNIGCKGFAGILPFLNQLRLEKRKTCRCISLIVNVIKTVASVLM